MTDHKAANGEVVWQSEWLARRFANMGHSGPVLVAWMLSAGFLFVFVTFGTSFPSPVWGPDDAMRLVQVRDFLGGQDWFDLSQYRLDPGHGFISHWSRIVDLPLSALLMALGSVMEASAAERVTLIVWPFALLLTMIWTSALLAVRMGGKKSLWPGVLLPVLAFGSLGEFLPGRIDHHGVQIVLTLWLLLLTLDAHKDLRYAALAGITCVLILAIGLEPMVFVLAAAGAIGLRWVVDGRVVRRGIAMFGSAIVVAAPVFFVITVPESRYLVDACDAFSPAHLYALLVGGGGLIVLGVLSHKLCTITGRTLAAGILCGIVAGVIGLTYPECLTDPYGRLDPALKEFWLNYVIEAQTVTNLWSKSPELLLQYYLMPVAGLAVSAAALVRTRGRGRADWQAFFLFATAGLVLALYQVRGAKFAYVLAAPAGAWLIGSLYGRYRRSSEARRPRALVALFAACFLFTSAFHQAASARIGFAIGSEWSKYQVKQANFNPARACRSTSALAPLNRLASGLILAPRDLGAHLLLETHHSVLAANYHRNQRGLLAALNIVNESEATARALIIENKIRYVLDCPGLVDKRSDGKTAADALAGKLDGNELPFWLEPVTIQADSPLKIFRVR